MCDIPLASFKYTFAYKLKCPVISSMFILSNLFLSLRDCFYPFNLIKNAVDSGTYSISLECLNNQGSCIKLEWGRFFPIYFKLRPIWLQWQWTMLRGVPSNHNTFCHRMPDVFLNWTTPYRISLRQDRWVNSWGLSILLLVKTWNIVITVIKETKLSKQLVNLLHLVNFKVRCSSYV